VKAGARSYRDWATTVADVKDHQVIGILPSGSFVDVATWLDRQRRSWRRTPAPPAPWTSRPPTRPYTVVPPKGSQVLGPFHGGSTAHQFLDLRLSQDP
jgi:hypothetical protein